MPRAAVASRGDPKPVRALGQFREVLEAGAGLRLGLADGADEVGTQEEDPRRLERTAVDAQAVFLPLVLGQRVGVRGRAGVARMRGESHHVHHAAAVGIAEVVAGLVEGPASQIVDRRLFLDQQRHDGRARAKASRPDRILGRPKDADPKGIYGWAAE